ncbi:MAG TPA: 4'-phosphopantetheinyl transferase superfamily protein [bacterium]|jgi:phosphopantetheinyl transferase/SAM-dependent methyltransferase|nr:4'-phosphopantetheinyl transferase superfamily protein [bacterium]
MNRTVERGGLKESRPSQVDLWLLNPEQIGALAPLADGLLSEAQRQDGRRFRDDMARRHWAGRQAALRLVLGSYLGMDPGAVRLGKGARGKPEVEGRGPRFSISSCEGWWLAAFSDQEIGVDLEAIRPGVDLDAVSQRYFNETELAFLQAADGEKERLRLFYRCWTRKESLLKLLGVGLAGLPDLREKDPDAMVWLEDLDLQEGLAASLALLRPPTAIRRRDWVPPDRRGPSTTPSPASNPFPTPEGPPGPEAYPEAGEAEPNAYQPFVLEGTDEEQCVRKQNAIIMSVELPGILKTIPHGGTFIDIGCGMGQLADAVARACPDTLVYGFDADPMAVDQSRKHFGSRPGLSFHCRGLEQGPPPGFAPADTVVLRMVLMQHPDPGLALKAARAWLKPGGILHVLEADDRAMAFEPVLPWLYELLDLMEGVHQRLGGSRRLGRELPALLASSGWSLLGQKRLILDPLLVASAVPKAFLPVAEFYLSEAERLGAASAEAGGRLRQGFQRIREGVLTRASIPVFHAWAH